MSKPKSLQEFAEHWSRGGQNLSPDALRHRITHDTTRSQLTNHYGYTPWEAACLVLFRLVSHARERIRGYEEALHNTLQDFRSSVEALNYHHASRYTAGPANHLLLNLEQVLPSTVLYYGESHASDGIVDRRSMEGSIQLGFNLHAQERSELATFLSRVSSSSNGLQLYTKKLNQSFIDFVHEVREDPTLDHGSTSSPHIIDAWRVTINRLLSEESLQETLSRLGTKSNQARDAILNLLQAYPNAHLGYVLEGQSSPYIHIDVDLLPPRAIDWSNHHEYPTSWTNRRNIRLRFTPDIRDHQLRFRAEVHSTAPGRPLVGTSRLHPHVGRNGIICFGGEAESATMLCRSNLMAEFADLAKCTLFNFNPGSPYWRPPRLRLPDVEAPTEPDTLSCCVCGARHDSFVSADSDETTHVALIGDAEINVPQSPRSYRQDFLRNESGDPVLHPWTPSLGSPVCDWCWESCYRQRPINDHITVIVPVMDDGDVVGSALSDQPPLWINPPDTDSSLVQYLNPIWEERHRQWLSQRIGVLLDDSQSNDADEVEGQEEEADSNAQEPQEAVHA